MDVSGNWQWRQLNKSIVKVPSSKAQGVVKKGLV